MKGRVCIAMLMIGSCGIQRPETREYFQEVTGMALCPGTHVRNDNLDRAEEAGNDFLYEVELTMPQDCEDEFYRALVRKRNTLAGNEVIQTSKDGDTIRFLYAG